MSGVRRGRALVLRAGGLGDFIITLPVITALDEAGWSVSVACRPALAGLARLTGRVREVRDVTGRDWSTLFGEPGGVDPELSRYLAGTGLVVVHVPDADGRLGAALRSCGAGRVVSAAGTPPRGVRASTYFAEPLRAAGIDPGAAVPSLPVPDRARVRVALHPGSGSPRKNWPAGRWGAVVSALAARGWRDWLLVGGEADGAELARVREAWPGGVACRDLTGVPLPDLAAELAACALWLGNDTGVGHLAAACGCATVSVFGPTDPATWAPAGSRAGVVWGEDGDVASVGAEAVVGEALRWLEG